MTKLKKYCIVEDDTGPGNNQKTLLDNAGKGKTQKWLRNLAYNLTVPQKREFLLAFYDKNINTHTWHASTLDFLLDSAIDTRFKKIINKEFTIKSKVYLIFEK